MADVYAAIYGRNKQTSIRFFWIGVAICVGTSATFFVRTGPASGQQYALPTSLHLVLVTSLVLFAMGSAVANAYFEGGFAISILNATAVALAFGLAALLSSVTGVAGHADAPQVLVFATFVGIAVFGGLIAWGIGSTLRGLKSGSNSQ